MPEELEWTSGITVVGKNALVTRGVDQSEIIAAWSYEEMIYLLLFGRKPSRVESNLLRAVIVSHCSHGITGQSTIAVRMAADCRSSFLNAALAGFLTGSGRIFLEHALLVSEVMVTLELACRRRGVRLLTEAELTPPGQAFRWRAKINSRVELGIIPDRVFALEFPNVQGVTERAYFFLEADRGTMPVVRQNLVQTSFYRKLLAYAATWTQDLHRTLFGFHRFRVLTVTESSERVKSLVSEGIPSGWLGIRE